MELTLVLHNIRSALNVGSILRTADGFGAKQVIFSGYTPRLDDARVLPHLREKLNKQIQKTALGAENYVDFYASDDIFSTLSDLKSKGYFILGLENNISDSRLIKLPDFSAFLQGKTPKNRKNLSELASALASAKNPHLVLILGEEVNGIDNSLYDMIDLFLEIPMKGKKESFNVSVATGIALYGIFMV